ncbi:YciI family protein [Kitasatospora sp. HPMI-4]|uniref:YciI family protein n=1 Tax=Kitasatospora sp. HPMI-4 TaxID=3448443 RepID=UPI003F1972B8
MKYLLIMHMNPAVWDSLSEDERNEVMSGHGAFMSKIKESGEFVFTQALAAPGQSSVVRVRNGVPAVTDGPYTEAKEFLAGYYVIDCKDRDRAHEIAAMIPDAKVEGLGIEVREIVFSDGSAA